MESTRRACQECEGPVVGRADKKFCCDACRNSFNNKIYAPRMNYIRKINNRLAKNRKILEQLNPNGEVKLHRDELVRAGFDFNYFTYKSRDNYRFCYDQGYLLLDNEQAHLVRNAYDVDLPSGFIDV